jgi:(2Fe-2S) ferredoxin
LGSKTPLVLCSNVARLEREPLAGTASHALGCVMVAYPKRLWGVDAIASEGLPVALRGELDRLREERDVITRFVTPEGEWNGLTEITFFPEGRRHRDVPIERAAEVVAATRRGTIPDGGEPVRAPIILCCTHGQRDRCCALFGVALATELRARAGDAVEIREASHLGGDRFAPTVLVLPSGHMYGHLEPADAPALLVAAGGGPPLLPRFRGSLWLEPLKQLAEVAAFALPAFRGALPTLGPVEVTEVDGRRRVLRTTVSSQGERVSLVLRCARERRQVYGDCRNADRDRRGGVDVWSIEETRVEPLTS